MFKFLLKSFIVLLVLFCGGVFLAYTYLPNLVSKKIQKLIEVPTFIRSIGFSTNQIEVNNLLIQNIPNSLLPVALKIDEITISTRLTKLFDKNVTIDSVDCDNFYVALEFDSKKSTNGNWTVLMNNIESNTKDTSSENKVYLIKVLRLKNVLVDLVYKDQPKEIKKIKIPSIELKNISSEGEFPVDQLTKIIIQQALKEIFSLQNLGNMLKNLLTPPLKATSLNPFQPFFFNQDGSNELEGDYL